MKTGMVPESSICDRGNLDFICTCECCFCPHVGGWKTIKRTFFLFKHFIDRPISYIDIVAFIKIRDEPLSLDTR